MAATNNNAINYFSPAKWVVSKVAGEGTHTTIAGALGVASSGDTIVVMPGTYTENNTISTSVNITGMPGDGLGNVIVNGQFTVSSAITVYLSSLYLQTNSLSFLTISGSAASIVYLSGCNLNCSNTTGISYSSSSASSALYIENCSGNIGTTGISLFSCSSVGTLDINNTSVTNTGNSTTASTISATLAGAFLFTSDINFPITTSNAGALGIQSSQIGTNATNTTCLISSGTGGFVCVNCYFASGTASAISIGSGCSVTCSNTTIDSTNTNAITGAGMLIYNGIELIDTSIAINPTTQTLRATGPNLYVPAGITFDNTNFLSTYIAPTSYTPVLTGSVSSGTSITYTTQVGRYQRVGAVVTYSFTIIGTITGSPSGNQQISLPIAGVTATGLSQNAGGYAQGDDGTYAVLSGGTNALYLLRTSGLFQAIITPFSCKGTITYLVA